MTTFDTLLTGWAADFGDRTAVGDGVSGGYSYCDLDAAARDVAAWLHRVVPRPPFLLLPGNTPDDVAFLLGALRSGLVPLIGDPAWSEREIEDTACRTGASVVISGRRGDDDLPGYRGRGGAMRTVRTGANENGCATHDLTGIDFGRFTSGSSGAPRCLGFGSAAMVNAAAAWRTATGLDADDSVMCFASLNNGLAFNTSLLPVFASGATLILPGVSPIPSQLLNALRDVAPSVLVAFPFIYEVLAKRDLSALTSLRLLVSSAAPLTADVERRWFEAVGRPVCNYYGLAEVGPVTFNDGRTAGALGRALPGVDIATHRTGGADDPAARIAVRTRSMATRYLDPRPPEFGSHLDADGYFRTQDLGYLDGGDLFVTGRADRIVNMAGRKIDPAEISEVLQRHPAVTGALVRGEGAGSETVLCAYVESTVATRDELVQHCRKSLAPFKIPQRWTIVPALPRSSAGKIMSAGLAAIGTASR
ncbi:acyl-coenzyme A synthetase/AMP-(fatty) acid ligase [Nocardia kruczakiae]|uniref:Acyl-coenzyme A synthetase/AMP-(Fatty) acid ligase n=1 Tax=Nocardia kruczakiae TaxID=261477 RepID=A0ABU1XBT4_9NOCA|nr:class I adenylate-forming enzyme family protein [Nocardia kruczakiae]MDR7168005.1 acyl-coenzyme A synthetase/AMP-(fatty) acid ligase [Nocardia kruczakiae]